MCSSRAVALSPVALRDLSGGSFREDGAPSAARALARPDGSKRASAARRRPRAASPPRERAAPAASADLRPRRRSSPAPPGASWRALGGDVRVPRDLHQLSDPLLDAAQLAKRHRRARDATRRGGAAAGAAGAALQPRGAVAAPPPKREGRGREGARRQQVGLAESPPPPSRRGRGHHHVGAARASPPPARAGYADACARGPRRVARRPPCPLPKRRAPSPLPHPRRIGSRRLRGCGEQLPQPLLHARVALRRAPACTHQPRCRRSSTSSAGRMSGSSRADSRSRIVGSSDYDELACSTARRQSSAARPSPAATRRVDRRELGGHLDRRERRVVERADRTRRPLRRRDRSRRVATSSPPSPPPRLAVAAPVGGHACGRLRLLASERLLATLRSGSS